MPRRKNPGKRDWQPRERRLVSEFCREFYPDDEIRFHVRLGSIPRRFKGKYLSEAEERLIGVWRRWADAVVFRPDRLVLIEAKIVPKPGVISQMEVYEELIPKTPEFAEHVHKPIEKLLLCAVEDPVVTRKARERDIRVVIFHPLWVDDYLEILFPRERRGPLE